MEELIEKIDNLKKVLDENTKVQEIKRLNKEIQKDKELLKQIKEYNLIKNESVKKKIMNNALFRKYKLAETDINIIILEINQKLKTINDKGKCSL